MLKCPVCKDVTLLMSEKNGVEIDYCPECRGIWLDRGELDKIMDRARDARDSYDDEYRGRRSDDRYERDNRDYREQREYRDRRDYHEGSYDYDKKGKRKKSPTSALSDILEIFGGD